MAQVPGWLSPIATADDATRAIKDSTTGFFIVAGLTAVVAVVTGQYANLTDAILMAGLSVWVRRRRSRAGAVLLLVLAGLQAAVTVANLLGAMHSGGTNIILSVVIVWAAVRAVMATFKLKKLEALQAVAAKFS